MPLSVGDKLGPYEIIAPIGKGGMGEVWKARDPRVGRDAAPLLVITPPQSCRSSGTAILEQFRIEVLSHLSHES